MNIELLAGNRSGCRLIAQFQVVGLNCTDTALLIPDIRRTGVNPADLPPIVHCDLGGGHFRDRSRVLH